MLEHAGDLRSTTLCRMLHPHDEWSAMKMLWLLSRTSCKIIVGAARRAHSARCTRDAVVCKAARSASAVLAAVGPSVGIGARAGGWISEELARFCWFEFNTHIAHGRHRAASLGEHQR